MTQTFRWRMTRLLSRFLPANILKDKAFFDIWQEQGYHITPVHFHEPIPDTRRLPSSFWNQPSEMVGIKLDDSLFLSLLHQFETKFQKEYCAFPYKSTDQVSDFFLENGFLSTGDAEILYCMVRHYQPSQIIEIGSGYSTLLMAQALRQNRISPNDLEPVQQNARHAPTITCIDPYPREFIHQACQDSSHCTPILISKPLEAQPWILFEQLGENDVLFIDSSHVVRIGGDVNRIFLEILPRLKAGVLIHIHDIFLPEEYPEVWVKGMGRFWSEQYLLQAFLTYNQHFQVIWPGAYMRHKYGDRIEKAIPRFQCNRNWMGSFWLRRLEG